MLKGMGGKITKSEFQKWEEQVRVLTADLIKSGTLNEVDTSVLIKTSSLTRFYIKEGAIQAIFFAFLGFEAVRIRVDNPLNVLGGLTFLEWENQIITRIKEHCAFNGYWNPNNLPNLTFLKERMDKVWEKRKARTVSATKSFFK